MTIGVPLEDDSGSWRRGSAQYPETAASEADEGGAMARSDLEPQDLAAIISVVEYAIVNFRCSQPNGPHLAVLHPPASQF